MTALNFILPTGEQVSPGGPGKLVPSIGHDSAGEPFDQVMTRALSPSETQESNEPDASDAAPTVSEPKKSTLSSPSRRGRVQSRSAASEKTASPASEMDDSSVRPGKSKSIASASSNDAGKGGGNVATDPSAPNETRVVTALQSSVIQFVTAYSTGSLPLFPDATKPKDILDASGGLSSTAAAASGLDSVENMASGVGAKAGSSLVQLTSSQLEKGMKAVDPAGGKMDPGKPQSVSPSVDDSKNPQSSITTVKGDGKIKPGDFQPALGAMDATKGMEISAADLPAVETASAPVAHLPQNDASASPDSSVEMVMPAPSEARGMSAAKVYTTMKKPEKMNKVAGLTMKTEKVLPGGTDPATPENNLPVAEADPLPRISSRNGSATVVVGPSVKGPEQAETPTTDGVSASSTVDLRSRALDRMQDVMALHAMRLVDSQLDSLHVVIKPGAGLELSLEMRQHGDSIDARVVMQRGDFGHLSQHWPELQQRLEQRGIRLAPLTGGENSTTDGGANAFQQPRRELADRGAFLDPASVGFGPASSLIPSITSSTMAATAQRRWETWA